MEGFATSAATLGFISLLAVGWAGIFSYIRFLLTIAGNPQNASYGNPIGMATVQTCIGLPETSRLMGIIAAAISSVLIAGAAWRWNKEDAKQTADHFDLMFRYRYVSLVTGFHMFTHDLSPLILAMFLVAARRHGGQAS